jgi:hypothetical protein
MKKLLFPVIGIAICSHFLSACSDSNGSREIKVAPVGTSKSTGSSSSSSKKNKIIIADLESYKQYIAPIIDHIKEDEPESFGLVRAVAEHSWFVSNLNKGRMASYIVATIRTKEKKQLAWHAKHAIFFDETAIKNLENDQKAELVLTQMVMAVYIKTNEISSRSDMNDDKKSEEADKELRKGKAAGSDETVAVKQNEKEYRFFDDEDLEKIQASTKFLLENGTKASIEEIRENLKENEIIK